MSEAQQESKEPLPLHDMPVNGYNLKSFKLNIYEVLFPRSLYVCSSSTRRNDNDGSSSSKKKKKEKKNQ